MARSRPLSAALLSGLLLSTNSVGCLVAGEGTTPLISSRDGIPPQAQIIDQRSFNVLGNVPPPSEANGNTQFAPLGTTDDSLVARPFHIYDEKFLDIIGPNPTLTLINHTERDPLFHEAPVWYPPTDEMFFCQNAGARDAGTGLAKSAMLLKIGLSAITPAITSQRNASGSVKVEVVESNPMVMNPNGGTNYKDQLLFLGEGQGESIAPAMYLMNPAPPYNTTVILDNFFGRQFNSLNDVSINPRNGDVYFTDPTYGYVQDFRPPPGMPKQVWRFNEVTGAVTLVADGFNMPNGIAFSPSGSHIYIADTGMTQVFFGSNFSFPSTVYRYDVQEDGTLDNRKAFAFVTPGVPDGIHVDTEGNVYIGCGDGVQVYDASGKLLGKIYIGSVVANFQFAGRGRMVILAETKLYYATLAAEGAFPGKQY
ncbi:Gluconolactonase [Madurella mycetomatis]|uniref:Gluconolactonase n=1 Tax=Madurella mycetomatis TaxID=100816 RepID=A0A175W4J8_9PEZI|nr:Gluconolactonase [Madurella mycetomatis]